MTGRPRTQIVPPQDVLDNQVIHTGKWTLYGLGNAMTDSDNIFYAQEQINQCSKLVLPSFNIK